MSPERVAAIIIRRKKILLITGYEELFYWTPGGKIENNESPQDCLERELYEEIGVKANSIKPYLLVSLPHETKGESQINHYYLVNYKGKIKCGQEVTKYLWYSRQNFLNKSPRISKGLGEYLIPKLIKENYL